MRRLVLSCPTAAMPVAACDVPTQNSPRSRAVDTPLEVPADDGLTDRPVDRDGHRSMTGPGVACAPPGRAATAPQTPAATSPPRRRPFLGVPLLGRSGS